MKIGALYQKKRNKKIFFALILGIILISPTFLIQNSNAQPGPETTIEVKPVGIVYSNLSMYYKQLNYDFYNSTIPASLQYYAVESHIYMAGLTYEVIAEDDITNSSFLESYSCLILTGNEYMYNSSRLNLISIYQEYLNNGGNIIGLGFTGIRNESNLQFSDYNLVMKTLFNVKIVGYTNINYTVQTIENYITQDYDNQTVLFTSPTNNTIDQIEVNSTLIGTQEFLEVINASSGLKYTSFGFASEIGLGRSVYFQIYDAGTNTWFDNSLLLMRAIQWCVFRDEIPIGIQLAPGKLIWMMTVDQDWIFDTPITTAALRTLIDLANEYHFTFGWAVIAEGPLVDNETYQGFVNWTANLPLYLEAYDQGNDIASHSVTHIYWDIYPVSDERALFELNDSVYYIEGNTSIPVTGLQVWGPGVFYARYNASIYIPTSGYEYVTELHVMNMPYLMGNEFYYSSVDYTDLNNTFFVLFRQSYSDHNYFVNFGLNSDEAWINEKQIFDQLYDNGRGMPYSFLWHDYSIYNESRIPLLYNMLEYELWNKTDVYACSPYELYHRTTAHDQIDFNVTYGSDYIALNLDTQNIDNEFIDYIAGQTIRIENQSSIIQSVTIDGKAYFAFSNNTVILPQLSKSNHEIIINLGEQNPLIPHINHLTVGGILDMEDNSDSFKFTIAPLKQEVGRVFLSMEQAPKAIFINGCLVSDWVYNNKQLIINLTVDEIIDVDIYYDIKISSSAWGGRYSFFPSDNIEINYNIENSYPYGMPLNLTMRLVIDGTPVKENEVIINVSANGAINSTAVFIPNSEWPNGRVNLEIEVNSNNVYLTQINIQNITQVYGFDSNLLLISMAVIAVFSAIFVVTNRSIASNKLSSIGRIFVNGLFGLSPIIFNLGVIVFGGFIYSQILTAGDLGKLTQFFVIVIPMAFVFFGLDLITKRNVRLAFTSEDTEIVKKALNQSLVISSYISVGIFIGMLLFSIFTGLVTFDLCILISIFTIPNVFLMSLLGSCKSLNKMLIFTGIYLMTAVSGLLLSFYISYFTGLLGLISVQAISIIFADVIIYLLLNRKFITKQTLPTLDPIFSDKVFIEKNRDIKLLLAGSLIITTFLVIHYLIWSLIGVSLNGYTAIFNPEYSLPIFILQLTIFPALGIGGLAISSLKKKIDFYSRQVLKKRKSALNEFKEVKRQYLKTIIITILPIIILGTPLLYFMNPILQLFSINLIFSNIELILVFVSFVLFSILWMHFKIFEIVNVGTIFSILAISLVIAIAIPLILIQLELFSSIFNIILGFLIAQIFSVISSLGLLIKKIRQS